MWCYGRAASTPGCFIRAPPIFGLPRPVFLCVGRVAVEKNLEAFLDLDLPGTKVVVGDGPARAALARKYPQAVFLGARQGEELAQAYAAADVFVFPSKTDTFGLVLLEALASGLPVAAFPVTGPRDVIGSAPVGALNDDLRIACLSALTISPQACLEFAAKHTWEASARAFVENITDVRAVDSASDARAICGEAAAVRRLIRRLSDLAGCRGTRYKSGMTDHPRPACQSADIDAAARVLAPFAVRTPLLSSPALNERVGTRVFLKPEMLQRTGSFKFRGAFNKLSSIPQSARGGGVVAFSSGNHAQGVAAAAQILNMRATIVMPADAPLSKRERTKAYGAEVVLYDRDREDREAIARDIAGKRGATLVPPYDDPLVIAGQGTVGREIAEDMAALGLTPDIVVAPASGGGLIAGVATAIKARYPQADADVGRTGSL